MYRVVVLGGGGWRSLPPDVLLHVGDRRHDLPRSHLIVAVLSRGDDRPHPHRPIGMEGASRRWSGEVDVNWAKEHHSLWLEQETAKAAEKNARSAAAAPAE
jgi:formate dehydrogenase subunit gamma